MTNLPAKIANEIQLSPSLERVIERIDQDPDVPSIPEELPEAMISEAIRAVATLERRMTPAATETCEKWVESLGVLCAGQMSARDAKVKMKAYSSMWDYPNFCYTKDTLDHAARRFKDYGFPSYGKVAAFLDEQRNPVVTNLSRLKRIAAIGEPGEKQFWRGTDDELKKVNKQFGTTGCKSVSEALRQTMENAEKQQASSDDQGEQS